MVQGNGSAFDPLYHDTVKHIYRYVKVHIRDDALVKDILQDTYVTVWRRGGVPNPFAVTALW